MRIGSNPLRGAKAKQLGGIIFAVITHLPDLKQEYHKNRMEVVRICLNTMRMNANVEATTIIWDNGSCRELRDWIQDEYKPDLFVESINVGKIPARNSIIRMLTGNPLIAFSDDDVLYYKNWFYPQLELLQKFPNVASACGCPLRVMFRWGCRNTISWAAQNGKLMQNRSIPREWEDDYARSIGRDPVEHAKMTQNDNDYMVEYNGIHAYCHSHHMAFCGYRETLARAMINDDNCMGDERGFDIRLDEIGLRLCTTERYTRHLGNVLDQSIKKEIGL